MFQHVRHQLSIDRFIYYDEADSVAESAEEVLAELEYQLDCGRADAVAPALQEAVELLRWMVNQPPSP